MSFKHNRRNKKQTLLLLIALLAVLGLIGGVASLSSSESSSAQKSKTVSAPVATPDSATAATIAEAIRTSKQEMYCYRMFAGLKEPALTNKIDKCLDQTDQWTTEEFDAHMPSDPTN